MSNKSQKIYLDPDNLTDKHIKVKLEQNVDSFEFLSMEINSEDVYQDFNADFGVLVGRVTANGGTGIPNARISIFIPLEEEDENDGEIQSVYPYKTPRDKNKEGKRYNLLPRVARIDPRTGILTPKQPFGSFPIKEEVVTNPVYLEVYNKYYKYTALTNSSGDYMIYGIPTGTQTVHLSVDITDIGEFSMTPASMVTNLGYSPNLFSDDGTLIKPSDDLDDLPHIETQEIAVDIIPFWGDEENFEIGITQQNFRVRSTIAPTFTLFGSAFTDGAEHIWGEDFDQDENAVSELYRISVDGNVNAGMRSKRIGQVTEKIYYNPSSISDEDIDSGNVDPTRDMVLLDPSEYSVYKRDGDFVFIVNCNRTKVITNSVGEQVEIGDDSPFGIFTKFRGFVTLEFTLQDISLDRRTKSTGYYGDTLHEGVRYRIKFPQYANRNQTFDETEGTNTQNWRKQHTTFEKGKFYTFSKFHGTTHNASRAQGVNSNGFNSKTTINQVNWDPFWTVGIIYTGTLGDFDNSVYGLLPNSENDSRFGANWLNMSIYIQQNGRWYDKAAPANTFTNDNFSRQTLEGSRNINIHFLYDNDQEFVAGEINTALFPRSDLHWTDIIEVPVLDIIEMNDVSEKGFTDQDFSKSGDQYRNGSYRPTEWPSAAPLGGGKIDGDPANSVDPRTYFYKGFEGSDCIDFLFDLNLITT